MALADPDITTGQLSSSFSQVTNLGLTQLISPLGSNAPSHLTSCKDGTARHIAYLSSDWADWRAVVQEHKPLRDAGVLVDERLQTRLELTRLPATTLPHMVQGVPSHLHVVQRHNEAMVLLGLNGL